MRGSVRRGDDGKKTRPAQRIPTSGRLGGPFQLGPAPMFLKARNSSATVGTIALALLKTSTVRIPVTWAGTNRIKAIRRTPLSLGTFSVRLAMHHWRSEGRSGCGLAGLMGSRGAINIFGMTPGHSDDAPNEVQVVSMGHGQNVYFDIRYRQRPHSEILQPTFFSPDHQDRKWLWHKAWPSSWAIPASTPPPHAFHRSGYDFPYQTLSRTTAHRSSPLLLRPWPRIRRRSR